MLAVSKRGFGESCGGAALRLAVPIGYAQGWVRLDDGRYEAGASSSSRAPLADAGVVDAQEGAGRTAPRRSWRGAYTDPRPMGARSSSCTRAAWRFAEGHVAKLELPGRDAPYGRASNGTFTVGVRSLELRLPVRERRGAEVRRPLAPVPGR